MADLTPVQKYKPNDPYYYEVDNIPIEGLEQNVISVNDELIDFKTSVENVYATTDYVGNAVASWYDVTTKPYVDSTFFNESQLFLDLWGHHHRGPGVYSRQQIDTQGLLATQSVLNNFVNNVLLPPGGFGDPSFTGMNTMPDGSAPNWNGGLANVLQHYYDDYMVILHQPLR